MTPPLPAVTQDELQAQIMVVRAARAHQGLTSGLVATARAEFDETHADLLEDYRLANEDLAKEEGKLRQLTLRTYHQTGNKKPADGVGIRERTSLVYDETCVKAWALRGNPGFLILDRPGFEAWAKVLLNAGRIIEGLDIQAIGRYSATIAKDLDGIYEEDEPECP